MIDGTHQEQQLELSVYPNPTTDGQISIRLEARQFADEITIKVCNLIGKEVYREKLNGYSGTYQNTITLDGQPKGIYILEVSNGKEKEIKRLSYI